MVSKKIFNNSISNKLINSIYEDYLNKGAYCGKIMGAGQSGFMFFYLIKILLSIGIDQ